MQIEKLARELEPYLMDKRRYFHRHPELSWQETATTEALAEELNAMGLEVRRFPGHTGVMGVLRGKAPCAAPKTLLLRADIDALPIAEKTGLPYQSETGGVMHACGHDGHTAMLLGAARLLCGLTEQFSGEIRFLFQSAEETSAGAVYYIEQGVTAGADAVFGMHLWGDFDAPWLDVSPGPRMASCDRFQITVRGVSAHGSAPQQGVDAVVAASALVMQLQTLVSRGTDPRDALVVTVGKISGGKRFNIIAD
ncbi:MAG TPA: amidohydrolase, partial [Candidatus Limiplasma sp.]|nr:amidohydrolase [Candidatus Limiplasma sp.]